MVKYIKTSKFIVGGDEGFITHEDQEVNGLGLGIPFEYDGYDYAIAEGEEAAIETWRVRVEGVYVTEEDFLIAQTLAEGE